MKPYRGRRIVSFLALLIPVLLTTAAVLLFNRVVAALRYEINQGGLVSCSTGVGGLMVPCEVSSGIRFALAGIVAAAITACATRLVDDRAGNPPAAPRIRARNESLVAAFGPLIMLLLAVCVVGGFGILWGLGPVDLLLLLAPYFVACVLGTLGFWAVLRTLRVCGTGAGAHKGDAVTKSASP